MYEEIPLMQKEKKTRAKQVPLYPNVFIVVFMFISCLFYCMPNSDLRVFLTFLIALLSYAE